MRVRVARKVLKRWNRVILALSSHGSLLAVNGHYIATLARTRMITVGRARRRFWYCAPSMGDR